MQDFHLISHDLCPYVQRAVIVLEEKRIPHRRSYIDLAQKPEWFRRISPLGRVPVLLSAGQTLFESQVIAEYLDEITPGSLHPEDPLEKARHRSWIEFGSEVLKAIGSYYNAADHAALAAAEAALRGKLARMAVECAGPYFDGESFHMIDGVWATIFRYFDVFSRLQDSDFLDEFPQLGKWRQKVMARPSIATAVPEGYPERLHGFLKRRAGPIGELARAVS